MHTARVILFVLLATCCCAGALYGFRVKTILRQHGLPVSFLSNNFLDLANLSELISNESDLAKRAEYVRLRTKIRVIFALAFLSVGGLAALLKMQ